MIVDMKRTVVADSETKAEIPPFDLRKDNQRAVQALHLPSDLKKNRAPTLLNHCLSPLSIPSGTDSHRLQPSCISPQSQKNQKSEQQKKEKACEEEDKGEGGMTASCSIFASPETIFENQES
jgi:hypothetical protein